MFILQRNPKNLDLNKNELLQLLCQVEAELEAREIALAVLKVSKYIFALLRKDVFVINVIHVNVLLVRQSQATAPSSEIWTFFVGGPVPFATTRFRLSQRPEF